jgi:hypothetical protein
MKKTISIYGFLLSVLFFFGCKTEVEDLFDQSSTQRYNEWVAQCKSTLVTGVHWRFDYTTPTGSQSIFILTFHEDNTVLLTDMKNSDKDYALRYSFNRAQGPILVFTTGGNPITDLAAYQKESGDIEFIIMDIEPDSIVLKGRKNQDTVHFIKGITGEKHRINLLHEMDIDSGYGGNFFHALKHNGKTADVSLGEDKESLAITLSEGNTVHSRITYTETGFILETPFDFAGETISEFIWKSSNKSFYANDLIKLSTSNYPEYIVGETADQVLGSSFDVCGYSAPIKALYTSVSSRFPSYVRTELYFNSKVIIETRTISIVESDTIIVSSTQSEIDSYIAESYVFKNPNASAENWNNYIGDIAEKTRADRLRTHANRREGIEVNLLNSFSASNNINASFFNGSGHTVVIKNDTIYLVSASNSKNWLILKKHPATARQIVIKIL